MADLDITGRVTVDASQAEGAFDRVGARAEQMSEAVAGAAGRSGRSIESLGAAGVQSGEKMTRAQARVRDQINLTTGRIENLGKTASQKFEIKIAAQGLDPAIYAPYLARLREVEAAQAALAGSGREAARAAQETGGSFGGLAGMAESAKGALLRLGAAMIGGGFVAFIKSGIDAADAAGKLAASTGLAAQEVAGLQLAFDQGDAGDKMQDSLARLARGAADGNKAFAAMGLSVTSSTGGLKSTRELLAEVADKFEGYRNGAEKTALAIELFGRSGADLIPILNGGREAMDEADRTAKALGLTLSGEATQAANQFNDQLDLVTQRSQGLARQLVSELLPALATIADEMAKGAKQGGSFSLVGESLALTLEALALIASDVAFVFRTIARDAKLAFDFGANLATVNFKGMKPLFDTYRTETDEARKALDKFQAAVVTARAVASAGDLDEPFVKRARIEAQAATEAAKKLAPQVAAVTEARGASKKAIDRETEAIKARIAAGQSANAAFDDEFKTIEAARLSIEGRIKSGREMLESIERETALLGLGNTEREQAIALFSLEKSGVIAGTEAYTAYAAKIREAISARGNKQTALDAIKAETAATAQAAKDAAAEWQKTSDSINNSLTDALMRGFEDGKGFGENLRDTLKNMFATLVLRPVISAALAPVAQSLSGGGSDIASTAFNWARKLFSFEGGGQTGSGPRSGGMDGRGGFMAMLHPNESVIDHTKGQSGGGQNVVINISNVIGDVSSKSDVVAGMQTVRAQILGELQRSSRYGGAMA